MDNPFAERSQKPTKATLAAALGRTQRHWDLVLEQTHGDHAGLVDTWMHYGKKSGWILKVAGKKRAVLWMSPRKGRFLAALSHPIAHDLFVGRLHGQPGADGTDGMVRLNHRCTKKGHNSVTGKLFDETFIFANDF